MTKCILCNKDTNGSIGKAGYRWSFICQKCQDEEDNGLERMLNYQAKVMNKIEEVLKKT